MRVSQFSLGVVVVEPALQAGGVGRRAAEGRHHLAQLVGLRPILGVVDHEIFAARETQREIAGLRLGLRLRRRHADDLEHAFEAERARDLDGLVVVGFEHDLDVELAERIVELAQRAAPASAASCASRNIGTSTVKTGSSSSRSARASIAMAWSRVGRAAAADRDQDALEDEIAEIEHAHRDVERDQRRDRREGEARPASR